MKRFLIAMCLATLAGCGSGGDGEDEKQVVYAAPVQQSCIEEYDGFWVGRNDVGACFFWSPDRGALARAMGTHTLDVALGASAFRIVDNRATNAMVSPCDSVVGRVEVYKQHGSKYGLWLYEFIGEGDIAIPGADPRLVARCAEE